MNIAFGEKITDEPLGHPTQRTALLANGHSHHSQWATPLEHGHHNTLLANGHSQIGAEVQDDAASVVATGRALDFQHKGSVSNPERSSTRTCSKLSRNDAA